MIHLDVTSSCKSPMNTGVQRVVRELFRSLAAIAPVRPVLWDPGLQTYCALSRRERGYLEAPFGRRRAGPPQRDAAAAGEAEPERQANPVPFWSKFARRLVHRRNRLDLPGTLGAGDVLFVPEIFQDNRLEQLESWRERSSARLVGVCHDAISWRRPEITPPARQAGFARYLAVLGGFDHVLCVSRESATDLSACWQANGTAPAPLSVAGWPVNHAGTPRPATAAPPAGGRPAVLCVGTFEPRKNHLGLLAAADLLWKQGLDFELVLVGRTTAHFGAQILTALETMRTAGRPVRWLRHVDDATLSAAYAACRFTVFPSLIEGFGLPILESLWHGRPCVCGSNGAIGEVSAGGGCLNVDQRHPAALATGMGRLLLDDAVYNEYCLAAQNREFATWEAFARDLLPLLQGSTSLQNSGA